MMTTTDVDEAYGEEDPSDCRSRVKLKGVDIEQFRI